MASVGDTCSQSLTVLMGDTSTLKQLPAGVLTSCHCFVQLYTTNTFLQNFFKICIKCVDVVGVKC